MYNTRYAHFSKGDIVRLKDSARRSCPAHDRVSPEGVTVTGITNAGFRGLEYSGNNADGNYWFGISAADLELVRPVKGGPIAWPHQGTYLDTPSGTVRVGP